MALGVPDPPHRPLRAAWETRQGHRPLGAQRRGASWGVGHSVHSMGHRARAQNAQCTHSLGNGSGQNAQCTEWETSWDTGHIATSPWGNSVQNIRPCVLSTPQTQPEELQHQEVGKPSCQGRDATLPPTHPYQFSVHGGPAQVWPHTACLQGMAF